MIKCITCKLWKEEDEFYEDGANKDLCRHECKSCVIERSKKYYKAHKHDAYYIKQRVEVKKRYYRLNKEKFEAHRTVRSAIKKGLIIKPELCSGCGEKKKLEGHHQDYKRKLEVIWLCRDCHKKLHRELQRKILSEAGFKYD